MAAQRPVAAMIALVRIISSLCSALLSSQICIRFTGKKKGIGVQILSRQLAVLVA